MTSLINEELALALAPRRTGRGKAITPGQLSLFGR